MKALKLPFGVKGDSLVRVSEVVSGLACGCTCPGCGGVLVARKGFKVEHHFAHHGVDDCGGGLESALHLTAKAAFETAGFVALPAVQLPRVSNAVASRSGGGGGLPDCIRFGWKRRWGDSSRT